MKTYKEFKYTNADGKRRVDDIVDIAEYAKNNPINWCDEFVYNEIVRNRIVSHYNISIIKFIQNNQDVINPLIDALLHMTDSNIKVREIFFAIQYIAFKYINWCITIDTKYNIEKYRLELYNTVIGKFGEFIWYHYINECKVFKIIKNDDILYTIRFRNISLLNHDTDMDFGVDLVAEYEKDKILHNCAIQVKCWNPKRKDILSVSVLQKLRDQAVSEGQFISSHDPVENLFVCWFGTEDNISVQLRNMPNLEKHVLFFDTKMIGLNDDITPFEKVANHIKDMLTWEY